MHRHKLLNKFFILQFVFAVSGCNCLYVHASHAYARTATIDIPSHAEKAAPDNVRQTLVAVLTPDTSGTDHENTEPETLEAEYEEDESVSLKRHSEIGHYTSFLSVALTHFGTHSIISGRLPSRRQSAPLFAYKPYLLFRAFRV